MFLDTLMQGAEETFLLVQDDLNTFVIALVILLLGFIVGRITDRALHKLLLRTEFDDRCFRIFGRRRRYAFSTRRTIVRVIYVLTILAALSEIGLAILAVKLFIGLLIFIVVISTIIGAIDMVPHLLGRRTLAARKVAVGDEISLEDPHGRVEGKVVGITLLELKLKRPNGDILFLPLASFVSNSFTKRRPKKL
ncbi:mechanosensitive ion channel family protein [Candidatus Woesearchaeota archaeon]|nr:mechanosensitive ion channel family protein [Candidatus Woesearchaeota archaeon]